MMVMAIVNPEAPPDEYPRSKPGAPMDIPKQSFRPFANSAASSLPVHLAPSAAPGAGFQFHDSNGINVPAPTGALPAYQVSLPVPVVNPAISLGQSGAGSSTSLPDSIHAPHSLVYGYQQANVRLKAELNSAHGELASLRRRLAELEEGGGGGATAQREGGSTPPQSPTKSDPARAQSGGLSSGAAATSTTPTPSQSRYWTPQEHALFEEALSRFGSKDVRAIARYVGTRNATQVRTHAQKYFLRLQREGRGDEAERLANLRGSSSECLARRRSMSENDLAGIDESTAPGAAKDEPTRSLAAGSLARHRLSSSSGGMVVESSPLASPPIEVDEMDVDAAAGLLSLVSASQALE